MDRDNEFKETLERIQNAEGDESFKLELCGEPAMDEAVVCRWIARSYGETSKAYHEAYNREIFRQARLLCSANACDSPDSGAKKPSWF